MALITGVEAGAQRFQLIPAFPALVFKDTATALAHTPEGAPRRSVVAFQRGEILVLPEDRNAANAAVFLDLSKQVKGQDGFEDGLHGVAFHPKFNETRRIFVSYSASEPRRTVLSEFSVAADGAFRADPGSERVLLEYLHPVAIHWGGGLAFSPDGFLYFGIGDGGVKGDAYRLAQNLWSLHGKILRIDVDGRSPGLAYGIPADNPFTTNQEARDEIWAYGIRNPWGMSFDSVSGILWCGDVGQESWEEVNLIKPGGNYGWSEREGPAVHPPRAGEPDRGLVTIDPIHSYSRSEGISITGGFVYRGKRLSSLQGRYLFGDWGTGKLWALSWDPASGTSTGVREIYAAVTDGPRFNPTVIAADTEGEPLMFSQNPSMIFALAEPPLLVEAEVPEDVPVEASPEPADDLSDENATGDGA